MEAPSITIHSQSFEISERQYSHTFLSAPSSLRHIVMIEKQRELMRTYYARLFKTFFSAVDLIPKKPVSLMTDSANQEFNILISITGRKRSYLFKLFNYVISNIRRTSFYVIIVRNKNSAKPSHLT